MKITIYELLGMIKDGKAPKKIKYNDYIYTAKGNAIECFVDYCSEEDEWCFNHYVRYENLNDEIEILEEEKKIPEKIKKLKYSTNFTAEEFALYQNILAVNANVNDLIDYLKNKGDE